MSLNKLYQFYVYLVNHCLVRIHDVADVFAIHRTTVWRYIRKLEVANLIRTQRTSKGVKIENIGEWRQDVSQVKVVPRKRQDRNVASNATLTKLKEGQEAKKKGDRGIAQPRQGAPNVACGQKSDVSLNKNRNVASGMKSNVASGTGSHVAFGSSVGHVAKTGNVACQKLVGAKEIYTNKHILPQLVTRTRSGYATSGSQFGSVAMESVPVHSQEESSLIKLANHLTLPKAVSSTRVRLAAAWIREWVDLPAYLQHLGISVFKQNRSDEHPCLCPLHGDTEPSMYTNAAKGVWHCHACSLSGDAVEMVRQQHGLRFGDATRKVLVDVRQRLLKGDTKLLNGKAEDALKAWMNGGKIQRQRQAPQPKLATPTVSVAFLEQQRANQALDYEAALSLSQQAQDYLQERALDIDTIQSYGIGWCQKTNRIVFPNRNEHGQVVGFTYRSLDSNAKRRYENTPNDSLYQKGAILFGLFEVLEEVKQKKVLFLCEGVFDALLMRQELHVPVVAMQAAHLSIEQGRLIKRLFGKDMCLFVVRDNDLAGEEGVQYTKKTLEQLGLRYKIMTPQAGYKDIAEQLRRQKQEKERCQMLQQAKSLLKHSQMGDMARKVFDSLESVDRSRLSADERLDFSLLYQIAELLDKADSIRRYLQGEIVAEGRLYQNPSGRYEIEEGEYFTSGESIEIFLEDEDGGYWLKTRIEHNGEDYYAVAIPKIQLQGMLARRRRVQRY